MSVTYGNPPLVEVAVSLQFEPPVGLNGAHLGAFWYTRRRDFPSVRTAPPIPPAHESFGAPWQLLSPSIRIALNESEHRVQMTSSDEQWMAQVQENRVVVNWRKGDSGYPRYEATRDRLLAVWQHWREFVIAELKTDCRAQLWEITYVNRIAEGRLWRELADWPDVFPGLWGKDFRLGANTNLVAVHGSWVLDYPKQDAEARLYVEPKLGQSADGQRLLLLNLTARGRVRSDDVAQSLEPGHELIVTTFDGLASAAAQQEWNRQ